MISQIRSCRAHSLIGKGRKFDYFHFQSLPRMTIGRLSRSLVSVSDDEKQRDKKSSSLSSTSSSSAGGDSKIVEEIKPSKTINNSKNVNISSRDQQSSFLNDAADMLNQSFEKYPRDSIACLLTLEILSIYGTHWLIVNSGIIQVPAEFAVAFALNRTLRRVRMPIEFGFAAILSQLVPPLAKVKVTSLLGALPEQLKKTFSNHEQSRNAREKAQALIDKYGISYLIGARWTGVLSVFSIYSLLRVGVDVAPIFSYLGINEYGSVLGTWAASVSLSSAFYPFTILFAGYFAPILNHTRKRIFG